MLQLHSSTGRGNFSSVDEAVKALAEHDRTWCEKLGDYVYVLRGRESVSVSGPLAEREALQIEHTRLRCQAAVDAIAAEWV